MLRQIKPRNARSKRALEKREPKAVENIKTSLFLRGTKCSQIVQDALGDLHALRQPYAKKFTKKNEIRPFEDPSSLEFFSSKNDCASLVFGSSNKKRPHAITFIRMFSHRVLDMAELLLDPESFRTLAQFKGQKFSVGLRPLVLFAGTAFESPVSNEYTLIKNIFTDFFAARERLESMDVAGLQYIVAISAEEESGREAKPKIYLRVYLLKTKRSGQKLPRVELEEIGPRMDFRVGRIKEADESVMKLAMTKPKVGEQKTKRNIITDAMGDKIGKIHLGRQDLGKLQTRKMKGLKRARDQFLADGDEIISDDELKRRKT